MWSRVRRVHVGVVCVCNIDGAACSFYFLGVADVRAGGFLKAITDVRNVSKPVLKTNCGDFNLNSANVGLRLIFR